MSDNQSKCILECDLLPDKSSQRQWLLLSRPKVVFLMFNNSSRRGPVLAFTLEHPDRRLLTFRNGLSGHLPHLSVPDGRSVVCTTCRSLNVRRLSQRQSLSCGEGDPVGMSMRIEARMRSVKVNLRRKINPVEPAPCKRWALVKRIWKGHRERIRGIQVFFPRKSIPEEPSLYLGVRTRHIVNWDWVTLF